MHLFDHVGAGFDEMARKVLVQFLGADAGLVLTFNDVPGICSVPDNEGRSGFRDGNDGKVRGFQLAQVYFGKFRFNACFAGQHFKGSSPGFLPIFSDRVLF